MESKHFSFSLPLLRLYYGCSKKFDREHKKNSYAGNDRSFAVVSYIVSRYIGHIIISLYGTQGGQNVNNYFTDSNCPDHFPYRRTVYD